MSMTTAEALYLHPPQPPSCVPAMAVVPVQAGMSVPPAVPVSANRSWQPPCSDKYHPAPDTLRAPWSLVCHLLLQDARGRVRAGTGWLAGPSTVFTAGRNLQHPAQDHAVQRVWVVPGRSGPDSAPFGSWMATAFDVHPLWRSTQRADADLGVVWLPQPLGRRLGCFGFAVHTDAALRELAVASCGYPDEPLQGGQWHTQVRIDGIGPRMLRLGSDTGPGHDGSPVFASDAHGLPVAVGMHVGGSDALRFTRAHFEMLKISRR